MGYGLEQVGLGSVPAWLGALSLILAFTVFRRDRANAERSQVDLVGAWTTVEHERSWPGDNPVVEGTVTAHIRNAGQLPVRVVKIAYKTESSWMVEDLEQPRSSHGGVVAWTITPGTESQMAFHGNVIVALQATEDLSFTVNVQHMAPDRAEHLSPTDGITARVEWLLVVDNAGRRWEIRPERGGRATRVRWWWRAKEDMLRKW
ncbi:hypothetical protein [Kribbella sp. NPDC003557]|uniref:hypothetical protein n=1 Tax=Kribbella sp. NPDC003557 TaxID=3154449 RepID=UPI0033A5E8D3